MEKNKATKLHMPDRNVGRILLIVLAVIGGIALIALLGMWLMMAGMMGGGTSGGMMECCMEITPVAWLSGFLVVLGVIAVFLLVFRRP